MPPIDSIWTNIKPLIGLRSNRFYLFAQKSAKIINKTALFPSKLNNLFFFNLSKTHHFTKSETTSFPPPTELGFISDLI
jgi:hypothetical protein